MANKIPTFKYNDLLTVRGARWQKQRVFTMVGYSGNDEGYGEHVGLIPEAVVIHNGPYEVEERTEVEVGQKIRVEGHGTWVIEKHRWGDWLTLKPVNALARKYAAMKKDPPVQMSETDMCM